MDINLKMNNEINQEKNSNTLNNIDNNILSDELIKSNNLNKLDELNNVNTNNLDNTNGLELKEGILNEIVTEERQNKFLETTLGKTINAAIDIGLRWVLPDLIEEQIIDIKNSLIKGGLKEGINTAVSTAVNFGKSAVGIVTGKFDNISQAQSAIKNGGIIDSVSGVIDTALNKSSQMGLIKPEVSTLIKKGKNVILDNVSKNIEDTFASQINSIEKLGKYENNWKEYYKAQDFEGMQREYQKIKEKTKELLPLENTLKEARVIENIHLLIKNNGQNFNLNEEQLKLANMLT